MIRLIAFVDKLDVVFNHYVKESQKAQTQKKEEWFDFNHSLESYPILYITFRFYHKQVLEIQAIVARYS